MVALDSSMAGFARDLEILDNTNNRTVDTAHVFYVKAGQTSPLDILSNVVRYMNEDFLVYIILYSKCGFHSHSDIIIYIYFSLLVTDTH